MSAPLAALLRVQDLDTATDQARHRRSHLPSAAALDEVRRRRQELASRRAGQASVQTELAARQSMLESELAAAELRARELSKRLYSGAVSASRDLQAMTAEIDGLKQRASGLEDRILQVLEEREPVDAAIDALDADDADKAAREQVLLAEVAAASGDVDAELAALSGQRAAAATEVPPELLATYERLRSRLGGVGAARLVSGRCDGCHLVLPATEFDRIRHLPADVVVTCDQCGRILVRS